MQGIDDCYTQKLSSLDFVALWSDLDRNTLLTACALLKAPRYPTEILAHATVFSQPRFTLISDGFGAIGEYDSLFGQVA